MRTRFGEIDLIVFDGRALVFVEVKTAHARGRRAGDPRRAGAAGVAATAPARAPATPGARRGSATERHARPRARTIRFDAVGVIVDERGRLLRLDHLEAAW